MRATALPRTSIYTRAVLWAWLLVLLAICVRVGVAPLKQSSYAADYAPAGWHWLRGQEIYSLRQHFVYSPPVAAFFTPFSALGDRLGGIVWRLGATLGLGWAAVGWLGSPWASPGLSAPARPAANRLAVGGLLLLPLAVGNVNLGQMNLLILALAAGSVLAAGRAAWNLAAVLLAVATFVKIYPLALGLLLVVLYPRPLAGRLALALAGLFLFSFGLQRPAYVWGEYHHWFATLGADNRLRNGLLLTWRDFGYLLRVCGVPVSDRAYRLMEAGAGAALAAFLLYGQRRLRWTRERLLGGTFCLACAWMMLFGPATEAATYVVLALPVCGLLVAAWRVPPDENAAAPRVLLTTVYFLLLLAEALNAWWQGHTRHLFTRALQPIAALLFVAAVVRLLLRRPPAPAPTPLPPAPPGPMLPDGNARL